MVGYWFYKFAVEDRDIGVVDYTSFEESKDIPFPVVTFCFENVLMPKRMPDTYSKTRYIQYLKGELYEANYDKINYKNVTIDLSKYFLRGEVQWNNGSSYHNGTLDFTHTNNFNGFDAVGDFQKCFEVSSNIHQHRYVKEVVLYYNKEAHLADTDTTSFDVHYNLHQSNQFLLAPNDPSYLTIDASEERHYVWIEDVESLRSRISHHRKCTPQTKNASYDSLVAREHIVQNGCRPPYLAPYKEIPTCNTQEKLKNAVYDLRGVRKKYLSVACERMSKISWVTSSDEYENNSTTWIFSITYPDHVRIIIQSKEVDIHTLIGNIGGYIGLFLGNIEFAYHVHWRIRNIIDI